MSYMNDPREMAIRPESGITLEEDNRVETMYHWGAAVLDLCEMPVEEYMKPSTIIIDGGGSGGGGSESASGYTLKFILNGNTYKTYKNVEEGAPISTYLPTDIDTEKYEFSGWADASGNEVTTMPGANLTLYATTEIKKFEVNFEIDGAIDVDYTQTVEYGKKPTRIPSSSKTGYDFSGWNPAISNPITADTTFVGSFTKKVYTLTFKISGNTQQSSVEFDADIVYPAADSMEGYTICGWTPTGVVKMPASNLTLTAVLSANSYNLTYAIDPGAGADLEVVYSGDVKFGQTIPSVAVPVVSGYSFTAWSTEEHIAGNKMPAHDVLFVTERTTNVYTLTYKVDGVEVSGMMHTYGAAVVPADKYQKEGYTVTDWVFNPALDGSEGNYTMPYFNVTATCETSINSYPVVIKHGDEVIYSGNVEYGTEISTLIPEGYSYTGDTATVPAEPVEINADINSYNVTVNIDGDEVVLTLEYKSDIESAIEDYIETNYPDEMVGHHIETNVPSGATVPAHDVSYTASIVPNQHTMTISGGSSFTVNYGDNILEAVEGKVVVDEFHYLDGWEMNGQPVTSADTVPDEDITVVPIIKVKESSVTPVISGETAESGTSYDYGTPISDVIEDIIASASPETQADLEDPGYAVEWTVNGSAYTEDMVVKEDEITVEVTITPKPFMLSFMRRGNAAAPAGVVESGETLYKEAIEYPELPAEIEMSGKTFEFKWDEGSVEEGTPMPSSAVTVYGEYVEKPVVKTIYYGKINSLKFSGFSENSPEFAEMDESEGMPQSKAFPFIFELNPSYTELFESWQDEDIDDDEFYEIVNSTYAASPVFLFPETISPSDYIWKRDFESVTLDFVKNLTINGANYSMWYEQHYGAGRDNGVEGYYALDSNGIDATIKFENK